MTMPVALDNPCINICRMDAARRYCQGCGRTALEIGRWPELTDGERAAVLADLPARQPWRKTAAASGAASPRHP